METTRQCSKHGCPLAYSEESEQIQNYGCLPTGIDILVMRHVHGKTWACHSNPNKPCLGGLLELKRRGLDYKVIDKDLLTENSNWHEYTSGVVPNFSPYTNTKKDKEQLKEHLNEMTDEEYDEYVLKRNYNYTQG